MIIISERLGALSDIIATVGWLVALPEPELIPEPVSLFAPSRSCCALCTTSSFIADRDHVIPAHACAHSVKESSLAHSYCQSECSPCPVTDGVRLQGIPVPRLRLSLRSRPSPSASASARDRTRVKLKDSELLLKLVTGFWLAKRSLCKLVLEI